jgi:bacterial leucyl aminopeptidase
MKSSLLLSLCTSALVGAAAHPKDPQVVLQDPLLQPTIVEPDEYLIELSPGETRWVTENEKWELRKVSRSSLKASKHAGMSLKSMLTEPTSKM